MGEFSVIRADRLTKTANIAEGQTCKFLIPAEFGGGAITGVYMNYGRIMYGEDLSVDYYELLAFMNCTGKALMQLRYNEGNPFSNGFKSIDGHTEHNRLIGISMAYSGKPLKYPLKITGPRFKGTYEDCNHFSRSDPYNGQRLVTWDMLDQAFKDSLCCPAN